MSVKEKYKFTNPLLSELILSLLIGFLLGFCTLGLY